MKRTAAVLITTGLLAGAVAGCSSSGSKAAPAPANPSAAVLKAATAYQEAVNSRSWQAVCSMSSAALRSGTVAQCVAANTVATVAPASPAPVPSGIVGSYADGSTPPPIASAPTPSGPAYASDSPVTASDLVAVPAGGGHPAGYGVLVQFTVTWPGQAPTTDLRALRLVQAGSAWVVDQQADSVDGGGTDQVLSALGG